MVNAKKIVGIALLLSLLVGCQKAAENSETEQMEINIAQAELQNFNIREDWKTLERNVNEYPSNAFYLGANENGIFYQVSEDDNMINYYFKEWNDKARCLLGDTAYLSSGFQMGNSYILLSYRDDGMHILCLFDNGEIWDAYECQCNVLPFIYGFDKSVLLSLYVQENDKMMSKLLLIDVENRNITQLYETDNYVTGICQSANGIFFVEDVNGKSNIYKLNDDWDEKQLLAISNRPTVFICEIDETYLLSERGELGEELGSVYIIQDGELEEENKVPYISDDNIIWDGKCVNDVHLWNAQKNGYILQEGNLWILDYSVEDANHVYRMEDDGFSEIVIEDSKAKYIKYYVNM